jgi:TonB family protein
VIWSEWRSIAPALAELAVSALTAGCGAAIPRVQEFEQLEGIVIVSDPPGARIVIDADTLALTPLTVHRRREGLGQIANQIRIRALPSTSSQCPQTLFVRYNQPTPDTVRFRMDQCPSANQDFTRIFNDDEVDDPPERLRGPMPRYPPALMQAGIQGRVLLRFVVDRTGAPERGSVQVVAVTDRGFVSSAMAVVLGSAFKPGRILGRQVRTLVTIPVTYKIRH